MINFDFSDLMQRHDEPECKILIQAIAALSVQDDFRNMTPSEVFNYLKLQAETIENDNNQRTEIIRLRKRLSDIVGLCTDYYGVDSLGDLIEDIKQIAGSTQEE